MKKHTLVGYIANLVVQPFYFGLGVWLQDNLVKNWAVFFFTLSVVVVFREYRRRRKENAKTTVVM